MLAKQHFAVVHQILIKYYQIEIGDLVVMELLAKRLDPYFREDQPEQILVVNFQEDRHLFVVLLKGHQFAILD